MIDDSVDENVCIVLCNAVRQMEANTLWMSKLCDGNIQ